MSEKPHESSDLALKFSVRLRFLLSILFVAIAHSPVGAQELVAINVQVKAMGRGETGTIVELTVEVSPEDRTLVGNRLQIKATLSSAGEIFDDLSVDTTVDAHGTATVFREWRPGDYRLKVVASSLSRPVVGLASVDVKIPQVTTRFDPPSPRIENPQLRITPPNRDALHFLSVPNLKNLSTVALEVVAPEGTAAVEFFQDEEFFARRKRPPWMVKVKVKSILERSEFRATALDSMGRFLGEDAIVINTPATETGLKIMVAPENEVRYGRRTVTVSVLDQREFQELTLNLDNKTVARWRECPCVTEVPASDFKKSAILSAELIGSDGDRVVEIGRIRGKFGEGIRVDLVELQVEVFDSHSAPVTGLDQRSFSVVEDGQEIEIDGVGTLENQPLSLVIAVDSSNSMTKDFEKIRHVVAEFADDLLTAGDQAALIRFASNSEVLVSWSGDPDFIRQGLAEVYPRGSTSLNDAIIQALMQIRGRRGRKAVVLITDGADTSSFSSFSDAKWFSGSMRVPIFVITLAPEDPHRYAKMRDIQDVQNRHRLASLARESGGHAFFHITVDRLPPVYAEISAALRSQYVLWYRPDPSKPLDSFRTVKVKVDDPKLKVRTISGYYSGR